MSIILNEHEWAKNMIDSHSLGVKPFETLSRVAKYYINEKYSKKDVRNMLDSFLLQCEPTSSLPKWSNTIDRALSRAIKYSKINIEKIYISNKELYTINSLLGKQSQRLAFTLLCLAKYWNTVNPKNNNWVNSKDSEIMRMANINTSIKRQSTMYFNLRELNMIQFSKKIDNTNIRVNFIEDGEESIAISDFRNLGYQYLKYTGEPYLECQNCGKVFKKNNNSQVGRKPKYCKECAKKTHIKQTINSIMKQRKKSKENK